MKNYLKNKLLNTEKKCARNFILNCCFHGTICVRLNFRNTHIIYVNLDNGNLILVIWFSLATGVFYKNCDNYLWLWEWKTLSICQIQYPSDRWYARYMVVVCSMLYLEK